MLPIFFAFAIDGLGALTGSSGDRYGWAMLRSLCLVASIAALAPLGVACGGATSAPPAAPSSPPIDPASAASPAAAASHSSPASPAAVAVADKSDEHIDPNEVSGTITMAPQVAKSTPKSKFPKASVTDRACWEGIGLTGDHDKDYAEIVAKCGGPTGLLEYAHPVSGKLHHKHDKRDSYTMKLAGGLCYRYFGVADGGITDLDILIEKPNGALVADDKTSQPVAIIEGDKPWCLEQDAEYNFQIEVDGEGKGGYTFGVWARPK